jgi:hypothetical protein
MQYQRIIHSTPIDALIAVTKRLSFYEMQQAMSSEDFYDRYQKGLLSDEIVFVEWANDYQHYLALRFQLEQRLKHAA